MEPELSKMAAKVINDLNGYAFSEKINKEKATILREIIRKEELDDVRQLRSQLLYYLDNAKALFPYVYEVEKKEER